jgi:hypothetical protein
MFTTQERKGGKESMAEGFGACTWRDAAIKLFLGRVLRMVLLTLVFSLRPGLYPVAPQQRAAAAAVRLQATTRFDGLIDELLAAKETHMLSIMSNRLDVLADAQFMAQLERRRSSAGSMAEEQALTQLGAAVCDFMEELVQRMEEVAPELQEKEEAAAATVAQAKQAAQAAQAAQGAQKAQAPLQRSPLVQSDPLVCVPCGELGALPAGANGETDDEAAERETRALNRFKVEKLLDAANAGVEHLDSALRTMSRELDEGFFEHLRWEVEQQVAAKNEKLLGILEVVVQRACVEAEAGHPEVELLGALLQTQNRELRQEMYQRRLVPLAPLVKKQFGATVEATQLQLEKALMAGGDVDRMLLQQLRVIALEMQPFLREQSST